MPPARPVMCAARRGVHRLARVGAGRDEARVGRAARRRAPRRKKDLTGPGRAPVTDGPNQAMANVFLELAAALEARGAHALRPQAPHLRRAGSLRGAACPPQPERVPRALRRSGPSCCRCPTSCRPWRALRAPRADNSRGCCCTVHAAFAPWHRSSVSTHLCRPVCAWHALMLGFAGRRRVAVARRQEIRRGYCQLP